MDIDGTGGSKGRDMRKFNTTGLCVPRKHYMVDISDRVARMREMVDGGDYFCINRARQYGKTTVLAALRLALRDKYAVASLDFQALSHESFRTEGTFVRGFCRVMLRAVRTGIPDDARRKIDAFARGDAEGLMLDDLFFALSLWCDQSERPVVLIVDEVDSATNNQVFLDFLAQLRLQYLNREENPSYPAFQSVVLAGVTDVKHLKAKVRPDSKSKVNSPWNIAADFDVRMSFDEADVAGMLVDYEADHATGMDVGAVSRELVDWTGGYPFLVSRICQLADKHGLPWDSEGVDQAVRMLLGDGNVSLFESLTGKLQDYPELKEQLRSILMRGAEIDFSPYNETQKLLEMYGFITKRSGKVAIANRVFETLLYDYFLAEEQENAVRGEAILSRSRFVEGGRLDMCEVLEGFRRTYEQVFGPLVDRFPEKDGRELFLLYLKPIINGTGNYYIEAQTRDQTRTDVVVDYLGEQFVVELKIWRGPRHNEEGERQVVGYLERFGLDVGYMLSFNFNKRKEPGLRCVYVGNKALWEETL